jgi:tetratricopeptide (TPR) repeat protein
VTRFELVRRRARSLVWAPWLVLAPALLAGAAPAFAESRLLVMPFENTEREARIYWIGEASSVLLGDHLNGRGLTAISRSERVRAFERLQLPPTAPLSRATVIKVGQLVGATDVLVGSLSVERDDLMVRARSIRLDTGRMDSEVVERGRLGDLFAIFDRLAAKLAPEVAAPAERAVERPPLDAFESYIKGLLAESPETQIGFLEGALQRHPGYDQAHLALWEVHSDQGAYERALTSAVSVPEGSRWYGRAQFLAARSEIELGRYEPAFVKLLALLETTPTAAVYNNLGIIQLRRGGTPQTGLPAYYFTKAAESDAEDPDYCFNLGYVYLMDSDMPGAIYWLREAVRRNPADADAHFALAAALYATGSVTEAARERELAGQLSATYEEWDRRRVAAGDMVPRGLERVKLELTSPATRQLDAAILNAAQREQRELARFHLDRARRQLEQEDDRNALIELRRAVFLMPYQAEAHLLVGRLHLRQGMFEEAVDALKISLWSEPTAAAHVTLAETYLQMKEPELARSELDKAIVLDPSNAPAAALRQRLEEVSSR